MPFYRARPRPVIPPVGEQGHLTPIRATRGSASDWIFRCRCGESVVRQAKAVRKAVELGRVPMCDACRKARGRAA